MVLNHIAVKTSGILHKSSVKQQQRPTATKFNDSRTIRLITEEEEEDEEEVEEGGEGEEGEEGGGEEEE